MCQLATILLNKGYYPCTRIVSFKVLGGCQTVSTGPGRFVYKHHSLVCRQTIVIAWTKAFICYVCRRRVLSAALGITCYMECPMAEDGQVEPIVLVKSSNVTSAAECKGHACETATGKNAHGNAFQVVSMWKAA